MNNIEILENFIDKQKSNKGTFVPTVFEITAIENLIQENKELKKQIPSPTNPIPIENQTDIWVLKRDYISKSKIKEKIEKLDKKKRKSQIEYSTIDELIFDKKIEVLLELLEEGE